MAITQSTNEYALSYRHTVYVEQLRKQFANFYALLLLLSFKSQLTASS